MSEGEGKYVPSEEEIQKAENTMTQRQETLSLSREGTISALGSLGISEESAVHALMSFKESVLTGSKTEINGHNIELDVDGFYHVDGVLVPDGDFSKKLSEVFTQLSGSGSSINGETETEWLKRSGQESKNKDSLKSAEEDIFGGTTI